MSDAILLGGATGHVGSALLPRLLEDPDARVLALVRARDAAIHRPSIVVGDSRTGHTRSFNVLYWPLKLYTRCCFRSLPGAADCLVDVVPVDFVAEATADLRRTPESLGQCFHLAAGDGPLTVQELFQRGPRRPGRAVTAHRRLAHLARRRAPAHESDAAHPQGPGRATGGGNAYLPYFLGNPLFDTSCLQSVLGDAAQALSTHVDIGRVVACARDQDFGRT